MFGYFSNNQLRKYILAFGSFFDKLFVVRTDSLGVEKQRICVPIQYGPKEKWLTHIVQDPDFLQGVSQVVPRIAFELTGISYDTTRKLNTLNQLKFPSTEIGHLARMYVGAPYTLNFTLSILTKFQKDGFQIVEQILPYFTPDLSFMITPVPELGILDQVPLVLNSITHSDNYEGDFEKRRVIIWDLVFSMKVFFYGANKAQSRIEEVIVDIYNSPLDELELPPDYLETEDGLPLVNEDSGLLAGEQTANTYLDVGRAVRIDAIADPLDQLNVPPDVTANVTITQTDGGLKRARDGSDEEV